MILIIIPSMHDEDVAGPFQLQKTAYIGYGSKKFFYMQQNEFEITKLNSLEYCAQGSWNNLDRMKERKKRGEQATIENVSVLGHVTIFSFSFASQRAYTHIRENRIESNVYSTLHLSNRRVYPNSLGSYTTKIVQDYRMIQFKKNRPRSPIAWYITTYARAVRG